MFILHEKKLCKNVYAYIYLYVLSTSKRTTLINILCFDEGNKLKLNKKPMHRMKM